MMLSTITKLFLFIFILKINLLYAQPISHINIKLPHSHKSLKVIIANTDKLRQIGLMNIKNMQNNVGMLFVFDEIDNHCFWMKNTYIPLSIAFLDENKIIVDIQDMKELDETPHCSLNKVKYALEVKQGFFKVNKLGINTKLNF